MRTLVFADMFGQKWCQDVFPSLNPAELPMAGKPWVLHIVDLCRCLQVTHVTFSDCAFSQEMAVRLGNGSYWSLTLDYGKITVRPFSEILADERQKLTENDDLLIIRGMVLPDVENATDLFAELRPVPNNGEGGELSNGVYLLRGGQLHECVCPLYHLTNLKDWFDGNFRMVDKPGVYNLPGYSAEAGFSFGANVIMMPTCEMSPPTIVMDNCYLGADTYLHNGVICGNGVALDVGAEISHSIAMDYTYIGRHTLIKDKIVFGGRVIEPYTGDWIDLEDPVLTSNLATGLPGFLYNLFERLLALFCAVCELPLYLLSWLLRLFRNPISFARYLLRLYPKFWKVVLGKAQLVRRSANNNNYVFRFSDMWYPSYRDKREQDVVDNYFFHNTSPFLVLTVTIVAQLKRLPYFEELDIAKYTGQEDSIDL